MNKINDCIECLDEKLEYAEQTNNEIECELLESCIRHLEELKAIKDMPLSP